MSRLVSFTARSSSAGVIQFTSTRRPPTAGTAGVTSWPQSSSPRRSPTPELRAPFAFPDGSIADWVLTPDGWRALRGANLNVGDQGATA